MSTNNTDKELNDDQLGPILSSIAKMPNENAPTGYFEGFQDKVLQKIKAEKQVKQMPSRSISIHPKYAWAASIALFIGFSLSIYIVQQKMDAPIVATELQVSADEYYLEEVDLEHVIEVAYETPYTDSLNSTALEDFIDADDILLEL